MMKRSEVNIISSFGSPFFLSGNNVLPKRTLKKKCFQRRTSENFLHSNKSEERKKMEHRPTHRATESKKNLFFSWGIYKYGRSGKRLTQLFRDKFIVALGLFYGCSVLRHFFLNKNSIQNSIQKNRYICLRKKSVRPGSLPPQYCPSFPGTPSNHHNYKSIQLQTKYKIEVYS